MWGDALNLGKSLNGLRKVGLQALAKTTQEKLFLQSTPQQIVQIGNWRKAGLDDKT